MYDPKLDSELFEDVEKQDEDDESSQEEAEIDDISDVEDMEVQTRKKVKAASKVVHSRDNEEIPSKAVTRVSATSSTLPLLPVKSKNKTPTTVAGSNSELKLSFQRLIAC